MRKLALGLVLLALAGCGGGGDDGDNGVDDTGPATTDVPLTGTIPGGETGETETEND